MASQKQADITVIGGGLAGLSACIEAATIDPSLKIVLLEREARTGGNSAKASSGINCAISKDDEPVFAADTIKSGQGLCNEHLVDVFVKESPSGVDFLKKKEVDLSVLCQLGGHSAKRTHRNKSGPNAGLAIILALQKKLPDYPNIEVVTGITAKDFIVEDDKVKGIHTHKDGEDVDYRSKAVIMSTGGFCANREMLKRFAPGLEDFPTTNGACAQGDGVRMAEKLDADLTLMDKVQLHPTGFINPKDRDAQQKFLAPEAIRGSGAVLLNQVGKRFVNELTTRDKCSQAILQQPGKTSYMWLFEGAKTLESALAFYKQVGIVKAVQSVKEGAEYYNLEPATVLSELNQYADIAAGKKECPFGKQFFPFPLQHIDSVDTPIEIHVMEIAPALHYTMGGVNINDKAQALKKDGSIIEGVYAAGEVSGGLHGQNRLGGNSLAECVVFGRIAARAAVEQIHKGAF